MRAKLLAQLNQVLQTKDTARGLIVSMPMCSSTSTNTP